MSRTHSNEDLLLNNHLKNTNSVSAKTKSIADPSAKDSPVKHNDPENILLCGLAREKEEEEDDEDKYEQEEEICPIILDGRDLYDSKSMTKENQEDAVAKNEEGDTETEDKMDNTKKEAYKEESDNDSDYSESFSTLLRSHGYLSSEDDFLSKKDNEEPSPITTKNPKQGRAK